MTYIRIKQHGTHQGMMFHNIQALLDMSQRSHTLFCSLGFGIRRSTIYSDRFSYSSNLLYK